MSQPLTDQRQRAELIAELYDLYAAGLFAYCADQLGDLGSASDVLVSVLTSVPDTVPPRAALYALARREIHRRDIVYTPPTVDPLIDPATALVERSLRELRSHHREVLVLCAVCGLGMNELAWVLGVAPDTADELVAGAGHRLRQSLAAALASTGVRVPKPVADVYGALSVSPLRDVLGRLPWPQPPGAVRIHFAGSRTAAPGPMFVKARWPSPPIWPQPLAEGDPATSTVIFPAELLTPPSQERVSEHEATTAPMPKLRDGLSSPREHLPLRDPLGSTRAFRDPLSARDPLGLTPPRGTSPRAGDPRVAGDRLVAGPPAQERPFFMAAPDPSGADPFATGDVILPKDAPDPYMTGDVLVHGAPSRAEPAPAEFRPPAPRVVWPSRADEPREPAAPLFRPRSKPVQGPVQEPVQEPVYRLPDYRSPDQLSPEAAEPPVPAPTRQESSVLAPRPVRARPMPKRRPEPIPPSKAKRRKRDRHYDWVWEAIGFLLCVAIAMIVFFSMPIFSGS